MNDFENAREYYRRTVELEPRGFFTAITALHTLDRESKGDLPTGTYLAYLCMDWITDSEKKAEATRQLAKKVPGFAPVWHALSYLADTDTERLKAIENGLRTDPDPETKGALLIQKAFVLNRGGDHDAAVRLLQDLLADPQLPSLSEHMAKRILSSWRKPGRFMWAPSSLLTSYISIHKGLYGSGLILSDSERKRVSRLFDDAQATLTPRIVLLLTDNRPEEEGSFAYVFFEPFAQVVIAISHTERRVSITADADRWKSLDLAFKGLTTQAEQLLHQGQTVEALIFSINKLCEILRQD